MAKDDACRRWMTRLKHADWMRAKRDDGGKLDRVLCDEEHIHEYMVVRKVLARGARAGQLVVETLDLRDDQLCGMGMGVGGCVKFS